MAELDERFALALHNTARSWRQEMDRRLKHLGVSQAAWMTIAIAARAETPLSQSDLADSLGIEGATMVAMVDRLVKAGFAARVPSTTDRRVKHVVLTDRGVALFGKVKGEAAVLRKKLLANVDVKNLGLATELLESLHQAIEQLT